MARIVEHPGYVQLGANEPTSPHDLALLVLDKPVGTRFPTVLLPPGAPGVSAHACVGRAGDVGVSGGVRGGVDGAL